MRKEFNEVSRREEELKKELFSKKAVKKAGITYIALKEKAKQA